MNVDTGEIRPWDSLSDAEKASGRWVKLPAHDADGRANARLRTLMDDLAESAPRQETFNPRDYFGPRSLGIAGAPGSERRGGFDALGRPR